MLADALTALADYVEGSKKYERPMRMIQAGDYEQFERLFQLNEAARAQELLSRARAVFEKDKRAAPRDGEKKK